MYYDVNAKQRDRNPSPVKIFLFGPPTIALFFREDEQSLDEDYCQDLVKNIEPIYDLVCEGVGMEKVTDVK